MPTMANPRYQPAPFQRLAIKQSTPSPIIELISMMIISPMVSLVSRLPLTDDRTLVGWLGPRADCYDRSVSFMSIAGSVALSSCSDGARCAWQLVRHAIEGRTVLSSNSTLFKSQAGGQSGGERGTAGWWAVSGGPVRVLFELPSGDEAC